MTNLRRRPRAVRVALLAGTAAAALFAADTAFAATITVTSSADSGAGTLRAALGAGVNGDVIQFAAGVTNITLASNLPGITNSITINGAGVTLSGGSTFRGLFFVSGTSTVNGLSIINAVAQGGSAGNGTGAGGGGAGLGGAIFVNSGANVTLNSVVLTNNSAKGGAGGTEPGGVLGYTAGGGIAGNGSAGINGIGVGGAAGTASTGGGAGGAIGGGGGGGPGKAGGYGAGGFGGGSGGGDAGTPGGFAAGTGSGGAAGGGGAGLGGAIFVVQGGVLNLAGTLTISGNTVTAGAGGGGAPSLAGQAFGPGIFLNGNNSITFSPGAGQIQVVNDAIVDQDGSAGAQNPVAGSGGVVVNGASNGVLELRAANTFTGGVQLNNGILNVIADNNLGAANNALTFTGGTLQFASSFNLASTHAITLNAGGGTIDTNGFNTTITQPIAGVGSLTKVGPGTLMLRGANTYQGGTNVNDGFVNVNADNNLGPATSPLSFNFGGLQLGASFNLAATRVITVNAGGGSIDTNGFNTTIAQSIGGAGQLFKLGLGTLTLTGANTYQGGTQILGGILAVSADNNLGTATGGLTFDGGTLLLGNSFNLAPTRAVTINAGGGEINTAGFNTIIAQPIGGTGILNKLGVGTLTVNGANTYQGGTVVANGIFEVGDAAHPGASVAGGLLVQNGTLAGHGTISGGVTNLAGTVAPGGTIGTLTVNGNFSQAAAGTLAIEVNPSGNNSKLVVNGNVSLNGKLLILPDAGTYTPGQHFAIIFPSGTVTGAFASSASNPAGFAFTVDPNQLGITLPGGGTLAGGGGAGGLLAQTPNQFAVSQGLLAGGGGAGDVGTVLAGLAESPASAQPNELDQLGGEVYADAKAVGRDGLRRLLSAMGDALSPGSDNGRVATSVTAGPLPDAGGLSFWGQALGHFGSARGDGNAHGFNANTGGATAGLEQRFDEDVSAGVALGYVHSDFSLAGVSQNGSFDQVALGAYGEQRWERWFFDGGVALGYDHLDATRHIGFLGRSATASGDGLAGGVLLKAGARYHLEPTLMLEPSLAVLYSHVEHSGLSETGANAADLAVENTNEDRVQSILGAKMTQTMALEEGAVKPALRLGWAHELTNPHSDVKESFVAIPGSGFTLTGASTGQDLALLGASVTYEATHRWSVYGRADAALGQRVSDLAVTAGFRVTW